MAYSRLIAALTLVFLFMTDCTRRGSNIPINQARDYDEYENRRRQDPNFIRDRDDILEESQRTYTGPTCIEEKDNQRRPECSEQCRKMYRDKDYREECENLAVTQIDALKEVHKLLEKPRLETLILEFEDQNRLQDLKVFLTISIEGFDNLARGYDSTQAKTILSWITKQVDVAGIFKRADLDDEALDELLGKISTVSTGESIYVPLAKVNLIDRRTMVESSLFHRNGEAVSWWVGYILNKNDHCNESATNVATYPNDLKCFRVFCQIGSALNDLELREDLLNYEIFNNYIADIIRDKVNEATAYPSISFSSFRWTYGTSSGEIEVVRDVDDFYLDLCKSRIPYRYAN